MRILGVLAMMWAGAALAQDVVFDPGATAACLDAAGPGASREDCIGRSAERCIARTPGGASTVGMGGCYDRERQWWDARLNDVYGRLMAEEKATDARGGAPAPSLAEGLRAMQRAWIPFRDAACAYERAQWGGGTGGGPATLSCLMTLTGAQALRLEAYLGDG